MRGKGIEPTLDEKHTRITPACAGKRLVIDANGTPDEDHPRVCGEKLNF